MAIRASNRLTLVCAVCVFMVVVIVYFVTFEKPMVSDMYILKQYEQGGDIYIHSLMKQSAKIEQKSLTTTSVRDGSYNYIITQTYGGQMTRAIRNLMSQQCWGALFGHKSYIVEPFLAHSSLYHSSSFWTRLDKGELHEAARFSEFYDLQYYNIKSQEDKSLRLATWENFIENAPRNSVVLLVPQQGCSLSSNKHLPNMKLLSNCSFTNSFQDFITGLERYNFHVVKMLCVCCSGLASPLTVKELHNELNLGQDISLLINTWRNFAFTSSWLQIPNFCKLSENPSTSVRLRPSLLVTNHTQYYKKLIIGSKHIVALMLRIERFLVQQMTTRMIQSNLTSCVKTALEIHDKIKEGKYDTGTFLTFDVGRFGSHVMQSSVAVSRLASRGGDSMESITSLTEDTIQHIYGGNFTLKAWEETFIEASGGITEMGYIAMLQRNIATEADCLILMGGGSFQQVAAYQYIKNHPDPSDRCLYTVCVTRSFEKSFMDLESAQ